MKNILDAFSLWEQVRDPRGVGNIFSPLLGGENFPYPFLGAGSAGVRV